MPTVEEMMERMRQLFPLLHPAVEYYEDPGRYPFDKLIELHKLQNDIMRTTDPAESERLAAEFTALIASLEPTESAPERIMLWNGNMPEETVYTENPGGFNHDPGYQPYLLPVPLAEGSDGSKGAIIIVPGGDRGSSTLFSGWQVALDLAAYGYRTYVLCNRTNGMPWSRYESGADTARAVRIARSLGAEKVAVAGFSNGGLTAENCILYFSGDQTVRDHFPDYQPDALDEYYGGPDAYICVYGPHNKGEEYDFSRVDYPPAFFAIGREDSYAVENLEYTYPRLAAHGVPIEVHSFAGTPHGMAGRAPLHGGVSPYPNFDLWVPLADAFLVDAWK